MWHAPRGDLLLPVSVRSQSRLGGRPGRRWKPNSACLLSSSGDHPWARNPAIGPTAIRLRSPMARSRCVATRISALRPGKVKNAWMLSFGAMVAAQGEVVAVGIRPKEPAYMPGAPLFGQGRREPHIVADHLKVTIGFP